MKNGITNDMYYGGIALRDLLDEAEGAAKVVAVASLLALGIGAAAACYFMFCRKRRESTAK